jgi:hypothetical protein
MDVRALGALAALGALILAVWLIRRGPPPGDGPANGQDMGGAAPFN